MWERRAPLESAQQAVFQKRETRPKGLAGFIAATPTVLFPELLLCAPCFPWAPGLAEFLGLCAWLFFLQELPFLLGSLLPSGLGTGLSLPVQCRPPPLPWEALPDHSVCGSGLLPSFGFL